MKIYFIQSGENGPIKIGITRDVEARLKALQTAHPETLKLLGVRGGDTQDEASWHRRFHRQRLRGEWFRPSTRLLRAIERETCSPEAWEDFKRRARVAFARYQRATAQVSLWGERSFDRSIMDAPWTEAERAFVASEPSPQHFSPTGRRA